MQPTPVGQPLESAGNSESRQLITTVVLMGAMLVGMRFFLPDPQAQPPKKPEATAATDAKDDKAAEGKAGTPNAVDNANATSDKLPEQTATVEVVVGKSDKNTHKTVEGDLHATLSSHGAQVSSAVLTGYANVHGAKHEDGKPVDLKTAPRVNLVTGEKDGTKFLSLHSLPGSEVSLLADAPYEITKKTADQVVFERVTPEGWRITRTYTFHEGSFTFDHELVFKNEGDRAKKAILNFAMVGQQRPGEEDSGGFMAGAAADTLSTTCRAGEENEAWEIKEVKDDQADKEFVGLKGQVKYAGVERHYFLSAVLLDDVSLKTSQCSSSYYKVVTSPDVAADKQVGGVVSNVDLEPIVLKPGEMKTYKTRVFMGPKQVDLLKDVQDGLDENVDFGFFGVLSKPILKLLMWIYSLVGNFGIAIILLTVIIKLLTLPLTYKSMVSMQEMKNHQPEIKALQKKYGHDRQLLGQKQMEFYQQNGINPMAGCFPMLIQMPVWFALYRTLWLSVELFQKPAFLWLTDLSQPDVSPLMGFPLLPLLVGALMAVQTLMQPAPEEQPQMKYVMWAMPVMFTFFMLSMPSGLSLYMITNSIWTLAQTFIIKKKLERDHAND